MSTCESTIPATDLSGVRHIRVAAPLAPEGAFGAMAGDEHRVVAHRPQALLDAGDQGVIVALRKVGAANRAGKQHITDKGPLGLGRVEHHMSRRMAGAVAHRQHALTHGHGVAVLEPARRGEPFRQRKSKHPALPGQVVNPELVGRMRADDGQAQPPGQLTGATRVVDVGVGQPDLSKLQTQALNLFEQQVEVAARVDDRCLQRLVAPDQGAILGKGGDGHSEVAEHGE